MVRSIRSRSRVPRIGLLTYHRSVNDGSIIQAWCLYQLLQRALPEARIEIIDYMPMTLHRRHVRLALYGARPPFLNPRYIWSYQNQQRFLRQRCHFSSRRLISDYLEQAQDFIDGLEYDAVVTGSDTIWEIERHPRPPNAYFRPCKTTPTFAFAASADPVPRLQSPCLPEPADVRRALERFERITVRDEATRALLERLGIASDRVLRLPDPTLLFDFSQHLGTPRLPGAGSRPLAALAGSPALARALQPAVVAAGFQVVSLMGSRQLDDVLSLPMFSTIGERLGLYPSIDLTITDRFHMTIFALKHGRGPVIFLEDTSRWSEPASKGRDLLTRLGLEEMVWRIDARGFDKARLAAMLAAWPVAAQGLGERLAKLRTDAEADDYGGIATALGAIVLAKKMRHSAVAEEGFTGLARAPLSVAGPSSRSRAQGDEPAPVIGKFSEMTNAVSVAALGSEIRPTWLRVVLKTVKIAPRALGDYGYDILRFLRHSSTLRYGARDSMASKITATCHGVERGLALPDPRPGFGAKNVAYLLQAIREYVRRFGADESLRASVGALKAYLRFNEDWGLSDFQNRAEIEQVLSQLGPIGSEQDGGTMTVRRADIQRAVSGTSDQFFFARHSIRHFTDDEVSATDIDEAIVIAQRAPAVCNRQECRVTVIHDKTLMQKMLAIQGSKGFNHQINKLLVVTNRLTAFGGMGERNQCWIDGGLFAMSLVLGLHSKGLGTCCLNWSKSAPEDRAMRDLLKIPESEVIIMLVAVGHVPAELLVARSLRRPLESVRQHVLDESELGMAQ